MQRASKWTTRITAALVDGAFALGAFVAREAHHSPYAMCTTAASTRCVHGSHSAHRAERRALRDALRAAQRTRATRLVRDANGEQVVWVVQMESGAEAFQHGITRDSFPQGTVFSMGVHPRRDGEAGRRSRRPGLFQCPKGKVPEPGKHCDSVPGAKAFGEGVLPAEGPVRNPELLSSSIFSQ